MWHKYFKVSIKQLACIISFIYKTNILWTWMHEATRIHVDCDGKLQVSVCLFETFTYCQHALHTHSLHCSPTVLACSRSSTDNRASHSSESSHYESVLIAFCCHKITIHWQINWNPLWFITNTQCCM